MVAPNAAPRTSTAAPPRRVGRYDLLTELGRGGMASVYLARGFGSAGFERLAAVKLLHRGLCADPDFVEMFLDEARVAARLHHPNATAITDVGAEGSQLYMVMDYVEGDTLHAVQCAAAALHRAVPLGIALRVALDALAGLDAAHELRGSDGAPLGLIHRDVTSQNVLIGVDGAARLVDFGIARAACRTGITTVGVLKGKLPFMAPEQIRGRPVDRRADLFSMGVTLWETIALRRCFPSREGALLSRLANEAYRPLTEVAPQIPPALDEVCRRALAFDPADRFSTASEFAEAIEQRFRADLATQRELGQFMSVVAAEKLGREREAVRASSQPVPARSLRPSTPPRPSPVLDLRPPRVPDFGPSRAPDPVPPRPRPPQGRIDDAIVDSEDVTAIAPSLRPAAPLVGPVRRPPTLPPLPRLSRPLPERASIAPKGDAAALYDLATQAFQLQRPRPSLVPPAPPIEAAREEKPAAPFFPEPEVDVGRVSEVRIAVSAPRAPVTEVVAPEPPPAEVASAEPPVAAAPAPMELPAIALPPPVETAPAPAPAKGGLRGAVSRLWARLFGA
ncbi:MAG: protein kinase [Deltaproteobacteria bacterium]|nr:protein kinase [Myxococcales bacterium]MDP3219659.1 protein kinase [Deltaproteobacteria bacterium]